MRDQVARQDTIDTLTAKWKLLRPTMDELQRRLWAAAEADSLGHGGIEILQAATGLARGTISVGIRDLRDKDRRPSGRAIRREGAGRKYLRDTDETLLADLDALIEPTTRGDPTNTLRWTCKSVRKLAAELNKRGHSISQETVCQLLHMLEYSLQSNSKTNEGGSHPDRDAQFRHIHDESARFMAAGQPVISVDAKKKEAIGQYKNAGQEWSPAGAPEEVLVHDFVDPKLGKAIPYGVYDAANNSAWVSVGVDHNTAEFAISTVLMWWRQMGIEAFPDAKELLITADGGGSNSSTSRSWKAGLKRLANATGLTITMCHYPPGTSKWNKIEHRLFSQITKNWRGKPLVTHETIVNLIANTTTQTGLVVNAGLDVGIYPLGKTLTNRQLRELDIKPLAERGNWNYSVSPSIKRYKSD